MQVNNCEPSAAAAAAAAAAPAPSSASIGSSSSIEDHTENIRSMIEMYVWDVLCSSKWNESMQMEASALSSHCLCAHEECVTRYVQEKKVDAKKKMLVLKAFKSLKASRKDASELISIPEAVSMVTTICILMPSSLVLNTVCCCNAGRLQPFFAS